VPNSLNMIRKICIVLILISLKAGAQNWASVSSQSFNCAFLESILTDSVHNELIVSSKFFSQVGSLPVRGVARWNGTQWDSLAGGINTHDKNLNPNNPSGNVLCCIPYNGKLLVGGSFFSMGGLNANSLALWDGFNWDTLPKRAFGAFSGPPQICGFLKKNNLLYIAGNYSTIVGQPANGFAKWDGNNYTPIPFPIPMGCEVFDIADYKNEIYLCGTFVAGITDTLNRIIRYDGTKFRSVGGGITGGNGGAYTMVVYNNELYLGGHIEEIGGNPAEHVMKWDGNQWTSVGFGGGNSMASHVRKLIVHNNKLFAFGYFQFTAGLPSFNTAVYDGVKWCAMQDTVDGPLLGATIFRDSICIAGGFSLTATPPIYQIAKLKDENLYRDCNGVGINELKNNAGINIYPNPVSNTLHIDSEQYFEAGTEIEITNALGQIIIKRIFNSELDVSGLYSGYYNIKIINPKSSVRISKFIKE
jgi:hypothetical protein